MITFYLKRQKFFDKSTVGTLKTPKQSFYTCEDKVRETEDPVADWKIPGKTAIPYGTYPLILDMSTRFKRIMPHIMDVPGFAGIRIHAGNSAADTEGCILLGWALNNNGDGIAYGQTRPAVDDFMKELEWYYDLNEQVQIEIA